MITFDEVRVKLRLQPFDAQAREHPSRPGTTTLMLCKMVSAASADPRPRLYLTAHTMGYARILTLTFRLMAKVCDVAPADVRIIDAERALAEQRFGEPGVIRGEVRGTYLSFVDHYTFIAYPGLIRWSPAGST